MNDLFGNNIWPLAFCTVFLGGFVQASLGFGLAIVVSPLLYMLAPDLVPAAVLVNAVLLSLANLLRFRTGFEFRSIALALLARIPGSIIGAWMLLVLTQRFLEVFIGVTVLFAVAVSLLNVRISINRTSLVIAGLLSGVFGTSAGIGGPPIALLFQHQQANAMRANLSVYFVFSCFISLSVLLCSGAAQASALWEGLSLSPALLLGFGLAGWTNHYLKAHWIRRCVLILCCAASVTLIL